jgi:hypothetical protein
MAGRGVVVSGAVEGIVDEAVLRRLISDAGAFVGEIYGKGGKQPLRARMGSYNHAAKRFPWVVLVDLDHDADCSPPFKTEWLPAPSEFMCFRVAVREIESWLLGDREAIAGFLAVALAKVPVLPDLLDDPKDEIVRLARQSRRRDVREDLVPRPGSGRREGPAYAARLIEFAETKWRPEVAGAHSESLERCRQRIRELVDRSMT